MGCGCSSKAFINPRLAEFTHSYGKSLKIPHLKALATEPEARYDQWYEYSSEEDEDECMVIHTHALNLVVFDSLVTVSSHFVTVSSDFVTLWRCPLCQSVAWTGLSSSIGPERLVFSILTLVTLDFVAIDFVTFWRTQRR